MAEHKNLFIPIGQYIPDLPRYGTSGVESLRGYFPYAEGFISVPVALEQSSGLTALNFTQYRPGSNKYFQANKLHFHPTQVTVADGGVDYVYPNVGDLFIGGQSDIAIIEDVLGQFAPAATSNVTLGGLGGYGTGAIGARPWSMASWSWDSVVATNYSDPVQVYYYGSVSGTFGNMITHGATSLRAAHVAVLGRHVVLANIIFEQDPLPKPDGTNADCLKYFGDASDLYHPDIVWWSGTDDETTFGDEVNEPGENTGWQPLYDTPGAITAMCQVGDRMLAIFKHNSIYLMELTGSDELFHFNLVSSNIGTIWPNSVVSVNRDIYFLSTSGRICVLRNGSQVEYVGAGKVNSFFGTFYGSLWTGGQMPHFTYAAYSPALNSVLFQFKRRLDHGLYRVDFLTYAIETDSFGLVEGREESVQSDNEEFPTDHPICTYYYDEEFFPTDGVFSGAYQPGVMLFDPYASFSVNAYEASLWHLGAGATLSSSGGTKRLSLGEQTVASPPPCIIHSIRPVASDALASISVKSYGSPLDSSFIVTKPCGTSTTANGWWTVPGGGISGQFFSIEWSATTKHHIIGFEIEYSLAGKRS